ncbi:MAG: hypothetical protein EOO50_02130 [Flavobacterium sp.]|uniref:hypothetical protein n=1 Tax=Flavobacterium sp. TaxID=239 RepID=UPI0012147CD1|nr:hypothetical protein [Flavobacterium sp.]RZJ68239.1 MAG: hypothetical protein EOO50_02130 [Flavobacterium sp.]
MVLLYPSGKQPISDVSVVTGKLYKEPHSLGARGSYDYSFWLQGKEAQFVIDNGILINGLSEKFVDLKPGTQLELGILGDERRLMEKDKIRVYSLKAGNETIYDVELYDRNNSKYRFRLGFFGWTLVLFLTVNGLNVISSRWNKILAISFLASVIFMRVYHFGIF